MEADQKTHPLDAQSSIIWEKKKDKINSKETKETFALSFSFFLPVIQLEVDLVAWKMKWRLQMLQKFSLPELPCRLL